MCSHRMCSHRSSIYIWNTNSSRSTTNLEVSAEVWSSALLKCVALCCSLEIANFYHCLSAHVCVYTCVCVYSVCIRTVRWHNSYLYSAHILATRKHTSYLLYSRKCMSVRTSHKEHILTCNSTILRCTITIWAHCSKISERVWISRAVTRAMTLFWATLASVTWNNRWIVFGIEIWRVCFQLWGLS